MKKLEFDFLVIGSGLAGLYSAFYASTFGSVALLTKANLEVSNSFWAQGGIAAAVGPDDNTRLHFNDTIAAGRGLCDAEAVKILVEEGKEMILELVELGVPFDKENGQLVLGLEGGHSIRRILHAAGDATGKEVVNFFTKLVKASSRIKIFENTIVHKLIVESGQCFGVYAFRYRQNENVLFTAVNTILATGGASGIFTRTTNPHTSTGDGIALAYNAGAWIADMEFVQFHPTSFYTETGETFLVSEAVRGEGAFLVNKKGERFMPKIDPQAELAPRDVVASAIFNETRSTGESCVYLKLDHLDPLKIKTRFSNIYKEALKHGIDITKDPVPVAPAAHYMIGGIKTGLNGETNITGLFVCGEAASTGVHGANRLASNSLLECIVFGKRAVDEALKTKINLTGRKFPEINFYVDEGKKSLFVAVKKKLAEIMTDKVGILRSEKVMEEALGEFDKISSEFCFAEEEYYSTSLSSQVEVCRLITNSALLRKESRGAHLRTDYTKEDPSLLFHIVQQKGKDYSFVPVKSKCCYYE